ncbi:hypothetical protein D0869_14281 [Hortaea werneckii]|uniref:Uncharacterized protein n=1 Tax=Hortaea werneckii TaxID=91943 RepID=A0A3M7ASM4_HORWE|nr:hypothetical protein D0869_14281 [Hortaea werneckii]RMY30438.1 hypothetical protein D0866_07999 [Hortaea werneckii]
MAANRYKYTREELKQYFNRICLPEKDRVYDITTIPKDADKLTFLSLLQKHQLVNIPWENLTQHYSWHRVVNVKPAHLFRKIVLNDQGTGRGGYCMEANSLWHYILVSLGFDVYIAGARIYSGTEEGGYGGWTHMVNLVTIAGVKYLLDGGFGPQEATQPLPLKVGNVQPQIPPAQNVLRWRRRGEKVLDWKFKNEDERVGALAKYFGITLKPEDREAIDGTASAINPARATGDGE